MARRDINSLSGLNIQVAGVGHLGTTGKVVQPKLDFVLVEDVSTGKLKSQFLEVEVKEYSTSVMAIMMQNAITPSSRTPIIIKGNVKKDAKDIPIVITFRGEMHEMDDGALEAGKEVSRTVKVKLDFYSKIVDGVPEVNYDRLNEILMINGVDLLAQYRSNVM